MIEAVFFDLDGTLYDRDALAAALVGEQYDAFARDLAAVPKDVFVRRALEMDDHGHGEKSEGYARLVREWGLPAALAEWLVEYFWTSYDRHCTLSDDTRETLATLRAHGKKLAVITNGGAARQAQKLAALGLADALDAVLISGAEGVRKPDAEIFRRALERCRVGAAETIFVGDNPEADIAGALGAGLGAIWKHVPYWRLESPGVPVVHSLREILPLCLGK
ncbi:MAG TPA: HAD family hydrolase [Gammaproteobacteria bacterium]|nr:HAD family hydrolase [Gammaproteobacteria bacterium]